MIVAAVGLGILLGLILILAIAAVFAPTTLRDNENRHLIAIATASMVFSAIVLIINIVFSVRIGFLRRKKKD